MTTCAQSAGKRTKFGKEQERKDQTDQGRGARGTGADEWTSGRRDDGGKKGGKKGAMGSKPDWYGDKDKRSTCNEGIDKGKSEVRYYYASRKQGHIGVTCQYKWANSVDDQDMIKVHGGNARLRRSGQKNLPDRIARWGK